ncbi:MAG: peptide-methionine (S)-S-oxide reductase MsrA [bacterium]|nr:peptide-methionine (S)-S-oxide reductase MsrA [bacterium]
METETVVLGGGCFWCTEAVFLMLKGVQSVEPGYAGSSTGSPQAAPTYEEVNMGNTPYIEVIKIEYDPDQIAFEELLRVFFATHDPTTPNRQGNDIGSQYQSAIFYTTPRQQEKSEHYIKVLNEHASPNPDASVGARIITKVLPLGTPPAGGFYLAEDYHKNYYEKNKSAGYCQLVIAPKVEKVEQKFKNLLK